MNRDQRRKVIMAIIVVLLLIAVIADRQGLFDAAAETADGAGTSARETYLAEWSRTREMEGFVNEAEAWRAAAIDARAKWESLRNRLIEGRTPELAEAAFRERVLEVIRGAGIERSTVRGATRGGKIDEDLPIYDLALSVQFDVEQPQQAYQIIDRLENMSDLITNVSNLKLRGTGMMQQANTPISCTLTLHTLAWIAEEGES